MGLRSTGGGEIVQVQGGHILRATGRKDRHSKVFTAKGPRDRRVRLSANTAIQFYDVQDRLGYDRPSKAVDWLMKKAKASIDKLDELPQWDPTATASNAIDSNNVGSNEIPMGDQPGTSSFHPQSHTHAHNSNLTYAPQAMVSESLADSMKAFFPTTSGENSISFQNYPHGLISRGSSQNQDLCLSLHNLQDPGAGAHHTHSDHEQALFHGSGSMGFDHVSGVWAEKRNQQDLGRFTRMMSWAGGGGDGSVGSGEGRGGILFNPPSLSPQAFLLGQQGTTASYNQRGTLQSSFSPLVRTWEDHQHQHQHHPLHHHHPSISGIGLGSDGLMGFSIPSQIHGALYGGASMTNRTSSSSLSPGSSQH